MVGSHLLPSSQTDQKYPYVIPNNLFGRSAKISQSIWDTYYKKDFIGCP